MEALILILSNSLTALVTGYFSYMASKKRVETSAGLRRDAALHHQELKVREQLFSEYRKLVGTAQAIIEDLQSEINVLQETINSVQKDYADSMVEVTELKKTIKKIEEECENDRVVLKKQIDVLEERLKQANVAELPSCV